MSSHPHIISNTNLTNRDTMRSRDSAPHDIKDMDNLERRVRDVDLESNTDTVSEIDTISDVDTITDGTQIYTPAGSSVHGNDQAQSSVQFTMPPKPDDFIRRPGAHTERRDVAGPSDLPPSYEEAMGELDTPDDSNISDMIVPDGYGWRVDTESASSSMHSSQVMPGAYPTTTLRGGDDKSGLRIDSPVDADGFEPERSAPCSRDAKKKGKQKAKDDSSNKSCKFCSECKYSTECNVSTFSNIS